MHYCKDMQTNRSKLFQKCGVFLFCYIRRILFVLKATVSNCPVPITSLEKNVSKIKQKKASS